MKRSVKLRNLYAEFKESKSLIFGMENHDYVDCHETCVLWHTISFYGIPGYIKDAQINQTFEGGSRDLVNIGSMTGCLILSTEMIKRNEDPLLICDDLDGDLGYAMSVLTDNGAPLNPVSGSPEQNVYYIHEIEMVKDYKYDMDIQSQILQELPNIIFAFLHVTPDFVVHYPAPIIQPKNASSNTRYDVLESYKDKKTRDEIIINSTSEDKEMLNDSNIISLEGAFEFFKEELEFLSKDDLEPPYPEEEKDQKAYGLYETNGFAEIGESRLLCLEVR